MRKELPPLLKIKQKLNIHFGSSSMRTDLPPGYRFKSEITDKITSEEISDRVYTAEEDGIVVVILPQHKRDWPKGPEFLRDRRAWNARRTRTHTTRANFEQAIEFVAPGPVYNRRVSLDAYHNVRMHPDSEKHTIFPCHMVHYRRTDMHQGDYNAPATIFPAMNATFRDILYEDRRIYMDYIIIPSRNYKQHVEPLWKVLQQLRDQQFWLKDSKCQFFTKDLQMLEHILSPEGVSVDSCQV